MSISVNIRSIKTLLLLLFLKLGLCCNAMAKSNTVNTSLRTLFLQAMSVLCYPELLSGITFLENKTNLNTYRYIFNAPLGTHHLHDDQITEFQSLSHSILDVCSKSKNSRKSGYQLESGEGILEWDIPVESNEEFTFAVIYNDDSSPAAPFFQYDADGKQVTRNDVGFSPEAGSTVITPSGSIKQVWQWHFMLNGKGLATITTPKGGYCVPALSGWHHHNTRFPDECGHTILHFSAQNHGCIKEEVVSALNRIIKSAEGNTKITMYPHAPTKEHSFRNPLNNILPWLKDNYAQDCLSKRHYQRSIIPPLRQYFCVFHNPTVSCEGESNPSEEHPSYHDAMKSEVNRINSLSSFPYFQTLSTIDLARAGFYCTNPGESTECKCFCCGKTYKDWKDSDNPYEIHNNISPNCVYINDEDRGNCSFKVENETQHYKPMSKTSSNHLANMTSDMQKLHITESPSANITMHSESNNAESSFVENSNNPATVVGLSQNSSTGTGVNTTNTPRYPAYSDISIRVNTYANKWPSYLNQTPENMANAGFLYEGFENYTRCFHCGCVLSKWMVGDDPYVEHARWFPKCAYLISVKGEIFIDSTQRLYSDDGQILQQPLNINTPANSSRAISCNDLNINYNRSSVETPIKNVSVKNNLSADGDSVSYAIGGKKVTKAPAAKSIIQAKVEKLIRDERRYTTHERSVTPIITEGIMRVNEETDQLIEPHLHLSFGVTDKNSADFSDVAALMYMSKGQKCNLNGMAYLNHELVACRHLAYWWLSLQKFKYDDISSKELIEKCISIPSDLILSKQLHDKACSAEGIYFEMHQLHEAIYCAAETFTKGQEKRYLLRSDNHAMGLCIKKNKDNNIIIYYYDPNDTLRHKKIIANTKDDLKYITCDDFWSSTDKKLYFIGWHKISSLSSIGVKLSRDECKVVCISKPSKALMYLLACTGHYGHPNVVFDFENFSENTIHRLLAGKNKYGTPALRAAYLYEHHETIATICLMIINSDLGPDAKRELLRGKGNDKNDISVLHSACILGQTEIVAAFIDAMDRSDVKFNNADKKKYLAEKNQDYKSPSDMAFRYGHFGIYKMLIDAIHKSCFWNLWASTLSFIYSHYR
ncbi:MAG: ShET2/EspL2 family type III secretion system effector toxin [Candidatus Endonucleobacter bathymodioli]|uniref:ShET2/EspL2 family type III secretion system effector toxin n=1 Tax=Candidatus Endonucleibacter bathymodioli TaxID=539814 RepID=A0AA90P0H9_9GAMM|nr:ShET2/EspL2 family type III secretion system effector toxin [Candidatus Endonucleobacter bathymodioli]